MKSIPALTGIRGVAALWVVFYHLQDLGLHEPRLAYLTQVTLFREGYRGVDLFFVLSGFILMYVHQPDFTVLRRDALWRFARARFWRVYPLNAVVLVLILALGIATGHTTAFTPGAILQSFTLSQRWLIPDAGALNGPSWSLSVELVGYAAFPVVALALNQVKSRRALMLLAFALLAALVLASLKLDFAFSNATGRLGLLRMIPAFAAGAALALFFRRPGVVAGRSLATISFIATIIVCSIANLAFLAVIPIAALVLGLASEAGMAHRIMASRPVVWLGKISFSLYLTHFIALQVLAAHMPGGHAGVMTSAATTALVITVVLAVSTVTYHVFERPLAQLSRHGAHRRRSRIEGQAFFF